MSSESQRLRQAALPQEDAEMSDEQLLKAFVKRQDEAAFEALMRIHGPMVFGVCNRVLRNHHDAEEAFQATFQILIRKASSIMTRSRVGCWLYGVAYRAALKAKGLRDLRRKREIHDVDAPDPEVTEQAQWAEIASVLDCEISSLPEKYRIAVVLCDLEGKSHKEVSRELGWPEGTISSRLMRARNLLAKRMGQRGFALSAGTLAVLITQNAASATVPASIMRPFVQATQLSAVKQAFISTNVTQITDSVLKSLFYTAVKQVSISLALITGIVGLFSAGFLVNQSTAVESPAFVDALDGVTSVDARESVNRKELDPALPSEQLDLELPSEELDAAKRTEWREFFTKVAADYSLVRKSDHRRLELVDRAVYTWARPGSNGGTYGAVYVWTDRGNVESVACFWRNPDIDKSVLVAHELHSLSPTVLEPEGMDANSWKPKAGLERHLIEGAPRPDVSAVIRMQQMRAICQDFSAHSISSEAERTELRLLPKPLYRYQSTNPDIVDGGLFTFVCTVGTDPEVFLQLEAIKTPDGPRWHFAAARFSHFNLYLNYQDKEVWQAVRNNDNPISHNADQTYWLFHKPVDRPKLGVPNEK